MTLELREIGAMADIDRAQWNALTGLDYPFLRHEFLEALESSGAATAETGWIPRHLTLWQSDRLVGVLPHYDKDHSFGEYIFDWQWADAWERAGGSYYPKQLSAIPFTPCQGPRLHLADEVAADQAIRLLVEHLERQRPETWHLLFPETREAGEWQSVWSTLLERHGMQYHWFNRAYDDFDTFLATMTSKRRKELRRERRKVAEQGLCMRRLQGSEISEADLAAFYRCYQMTYLEHGQRGYLNYEFFSRVLETMPEALVLVQAMYGEQPVAAALCFQGRDTLYGRYWGSEVEADCLHFETCYYQGIEHCILQGLHRFDPGTQGEHKVPRGFEPIVTRSLHWIRHPRFRDAIGDFLSRERPMVAERMQEARELLPFKVIENE
ncbi:GNAT family N-acetyltransferase [Kushneria phosphatilytica]|uniref:N-acetyltransferase n=1 Tax=Kushneria phosphatilytica TaxID=657387 RepID=A0A1S1NVN5_9GAMM|nr:GNAT family N-acetyltransferase [Kushneria phosphatilytica]OHV10638.1 GNAT family N-acetyltransferase [Kushneria phosphatilytica]QEL11856.1 N-acetyltransferase [Kushneria phosphatilytica]